MEDTKRIRITDFGQTRILGLTAQSFEELQIKGKARFKNHNTFMIRMKTSKPIENEAQFDELSSIGEMVKFTSIVPKELSDFKGDKFVRNLEKLSQDLFTIKTLSFKELQNIKQMKIEEYTPHFEREFLERVSKIAEEVILWKELDTDSSVIRAATFLCICTVIGEKCIGISLLNPKSSFSYMSNDPARSNQFYEKILELKTSFEADGLGVILEPKSFFKQASYDSTQWQYRDLDILKEIMDYFKSERDDCVIAFPDSNSKFIPNRGCFIVNLSKGYMMIFVIENEVINDVQFKECLQKIMKCKEELLQCCNFIKDIECQWLCIGILYSYIGAAQCNCDTCSQFAITGNESAHQKLKNVDAKVKEGQPCWKPEKHIYELLDILQSSPEQKKPSINMDLCKEDPLASNFLNLAVDEKGGDDPIGKKRKFTVPRFSKNHH